MPDVPLCRDCANFLPAWKHEVFGYGGPELCTVEHEATEPGTNDRIKDPNSMRSYGPCGAEGKLFEPRVKREPKITV